MIPIGLIIIIAVIMLLTVAYPPEASNMAPTRGPSVPSEGWWR